MTINGIILHYGLRPADVLVVNRTNRGLLNLIDHYLVYMGQDRSGRPVFMANLGDRVQWLSANDIIRKAPGFSIHHPRYFKGTERQREQALQRAKQCVNHKYRLLGFNCEHFANYVQKGEATSRQANWGMGIAAALGVLAIGFLAARD